MTSVPGASATGGPVAGASRTPENPFAGATTIVATAHCVADRIGARGEGDVGNIEPSPRRIAGEGGGRVFVFRFGVIVTIGLDAEHQRRAIDAVAPRFVEPHDRIAVESATIRIDPLARDGIGDSGEIIVPTADEPRLTAIAEVIAKSAALAHYEERVAEVFDRVEALARELREARLPHDRKALLREIGEVLRIRARMVGRIEVTEKPDFLWESPELDRFYVLLAREYELAERDRGQARRLEVIAGVAETFLELLNHRQTLRVEWYIVILIVVEIALGLFEMARGS